MELSKQNRLIKLAYSKGYVVTNCGSKVHSKEGKELRLSKQKRGGKLYLSFNIRPKGENPTRVYVHKLQAYQKFKEGMFIKGIVVRHMNDVSLDNTFINLKLGTQKQNMQDRARNGRER